MGRNLVLLTVKSIELKSAYDGRGRDLVLLHDPPIALKSAPS